MGRGKVFTLADLELIRSKCVEAKKVKEADGLSGAVGVEAMMAYLPPSMKRTQVQNALAAFKAGKTPVSLVKQQQTNLARCGRASATEEKAEQARAMPSANNSSKVHSQRKMAKKVKLSLGAVNKIVKKSLKCARSSASRRRKTQRRH